MHRIPLFLLLLSLTTCRQASINKYTVEIDLTDVIDDRLKVNCEVPTVFQDEIEFRIPKIVPGTYWYSNYGRFISKFEAYDSQGIKLETVKITDNRILIKNSKRLKSITYWVDDTFDSGTNIYKAAGTNIEEGKNFVINTFGFVGYLEGMEDYPYELQVEHPSDMYGATALNRTASTNSKDVFSAASYSKLADGPIMYSIPDTTRFKIGNADILISVYSPNKKLDPTYLRKQIKPTLKSQLAYLGEFPVNKYVFIIYLCDPNVSRQKHALEHSYSSFYYLPEFEPKRLSKWIRNTAAHEFFHILTPLNIHSEEIGNFDFINPKMSKHLWMYEGVTEYAAGLTQVKYGEMGLTEYLKLLEGKLDRSQSSYDDNLPFTELSEQCLGSARGQYSNVYSKGALIGLALDIRLRELSDGKYGIQNMMMDLSEKYGKNTSFQDNDLFDDITALTYPEIRSFFAKYVEGTSSLPYNNIFNKVGLDYSVATEGENMNWNTRNNVSYTLTLNDDPTPEQLALRRSWIDK